MGDRDFTAARRRLTRLRLRALGIAPPTATRPAEAVGRLLALQAQDYHGALWAVGLRTPGAGVADVTAAHHDGALVRGWPFRSTLHLTLAEDLGWLSAVTAERQHRAAAGRHRELELSDRDFARADAIARDRLHGGARLERTELLAAFEAEGLSTAGQRGAHLLVRLAQTGVAALCAQNTWTLLADHVAAPRWFEGVAALAEIARRYVATRGPATDRDLAWWAGITLTDARAALATIDDEVDRTVVDGVEYRLPFGLDEAPGGIHLLPGFDEYLLGYTDRSAPLAGRPLETVVPGRNGMFLSTVVLDGEVVATWRRTVRTRDVAIEVDELRPLSATARAGIRRAARRYADYLGLDLRE